MFVRAQHVASSPALRVSDRHSGPALDPLAILEVAAQTRVSSTTKNIANKENLLQLSFNQWVAVCSADLAVEIRGRLFIAYGDSFLFPRRGSSWPTETLDTSAIRKRGGNPATGISLDKTRNTKRTKFIATCL